MAPRQSAPPRRDGPLARQGFRIGITIGTGQALSAPLLLADRAAQASLFLHDLFRAMPECGGAFVVVSGEETRLPGELAIPAEQVMRLEDCGGALDVLIVVSRFVEPELLRALRRRGVAIIAYKARNGAVGAIESAISSDRDKFAERYLDHDCYDRVWMPRQFLPTFEAWSRTLYRVEVVGVPELWSPRMEALVPEPIRQGFGYRAGRAPSKAGKPPWRVGVLEANDSVTSTFHLPMLACEFAYRRRPKAFKAFYIANSAHYAGDNHVVSLAHKLSAARDGVMTFEPNFHAWEFLGLHCDAIVTHQWGVMNHGLIFEALHGRYPLAHNSPWLKDYGYYFEEFAAEEGGKALVEAYQRHDRDAERYERTCAALLAQVHPRNAGNIAAFRACLP